MVRSLGLLSQEYMEWVRSLKQNDYVDALRIDRVSGRSCWSRA